jgi:hypothetical protein
LIAAYLKMSSSNVLNFTSSRIRPLIVLRARRQVHQ